MRKYLDLTSWILLFFFAPFTVLVLLSQNSLPGDFFYPVKRGLENIILAAASVSPSTKVAFRTGLTQTRFNEAQKLLITKADTSAFNDFVAEVSSAQQDLTTVKSSTDKIQSSDKLIAKIEEYQTQLSQTQNQVQIAQALPSARAGSSFAGQNQPQQTVAQTTPPTSSQTTPAPTSTPISQLVQTTTPTQPAQTTQPVVQTAAPVVQTTAPTSVPTPQPLAPGVTNEIANNPQKAEEVKEKIKDTQDHLEKIKEQIKKEKEDAQVQEKANEDQQKLNEELNKQKKEENEPTATPHNK